VAAGVVISSEAGCAFGTQEEGRLGASAVVARTPIAVPTFVAPPRRLDAMLKSARPYPAPKLS
jgi:myo-inositol-1(or 4)-monophosphatase